MNAPLFAKQAASRPYIIMRRDLLTLDLYDLVLVFVFCQSISSLAAARRVLGH